MKNLVLYTFKQARRVLLSLLLVAGATSVWADVASGKLKNGSWKITDGGELNIQVNGAISNFTEGIPAPWNAYASSVVTVTSNATGIGDYAFYGMSKIYEVSFPLATSIGDYAFFNVTHLSKVALPNAISIGDYAFAIDKYTTNNPIIPDLKELFLPKVKTVGIRAFRNTRIARIYMPEAETINDQAFADYYIFEQQRSEIMVILGSKVKTLGKELFHGRAIYSLDPCKAPALFLSAPTPPDLGSAMSSFRYSSDKGYARVCVPSSLIETYRKAFDEWGSGDNTSAKIDDYDRIVIGQAAASGSKVQCWWAKQDGNMSICYPNGWTDGHTYTTAPWATDIKSGSGNLYLLTAPGEGAFQDCDLLNTVYMGGSNMNIQASAFRNSSIKELKKTATSWIYSIGNDAFNGCKELTWAEGLSLVREFGARAFLNCQLRTSADLSAATTIGESAFENGTLNSEVVLKNIVTIGKRAFYGSRIVLIKFGSALKTIGDEAFAGRQTAATILSTDIYVEGYAPTVGTDAFKGFTKAKTTLHVESAWASQYMTTPWNGFSVSNSAYPLDGDGWSISSDGILTITKNIASQASETDALKNNPWLSYIDDVKTILIENGVTMVGDYAFWHASNDQSALETVSVPRSLEKIGAHAFENHRSLITIFVNDVKEVGDYAFAGCTSMERIEFGTRCERLGDFILNGCKSLTELYTSVTSPPIVSSRTFNGAGAEMIAHARGQKRASSYKYSVRAYVPGPSFVDYITTDGWDQLTYEDGEHGEVIFARDLGTSEGKCILYADGYLDISCKSEKLNPVVEEKSNPIRYITWFGYGDDIKTVHVHEGPTTLDNYNFIKGTFEGLKNLETVILPTSITTVNSYAFRDCPKLKSISMPNVEYIDYDVFCRCTSLAEVNLPRVTKVGGGAFDGCSSLKTINFTPLELTGTSAFSGCTSLESIDISSVGLVDYHSFKDCTSLKEVRINGNIRAGAFEGCTQLKTIYLGEKVWYVADEFLKGSGVTDIYMASPRPPQDQYQIWAFNPFGGIDASKVTCHLPADYLPAYEADQNWGKLNLVADDSYEEEVFPMGGLFGKNGLWTIDEGGIMTYEVTGESVNLKEQLQLYTSYVKRLYISDGCTSLENFYGIYANCTDLVVGKDLTYMGGFMEAFITPDQDYQDFHVFKTSLNNVFMFAPTPPEFKFNGLHQDGMNDEDVINSHGTVLHVLKTPGVKEAYEADAEWSKFTTIVADLDPGVMPTEAEMTIAAPSLSVGKRSALPVKLTSTQTIREMTFTLKLTEGLRVAKDAEGKLTATLTAEGTEPVLLTGSTDDERVYVFHMESEDGVELGDKGADLAIDIVTDADVAEGDFYYARITNIEMVTVKGQTLTPNAAMVNLTVTAVTALPGDVNGDGEVNITDVTMTISHILGQNPTGFDASAADVDGNGDVNITDVTTMIDMVLKK